MSRRNRDRNNKPGDGSALPNMKRHQFIYRSIFELSPDPAVDRAGKYAVDVDYFDFSERLKLYHDGKQIAVGTSPAEFRVPGGKIEAEMGIYGMSRVHFVTPDGQEQALRPMPGTAEAWRAWFARQHPEASRVIGITAIVILLASLGLLALTLVEAISKFDWVAANIGTFTSPIVLPEWFAISLSVAAVAAAIERALTLRNHWLIDADTWWLES
ncbi:hypothetical protein EG850_03800 [Gulosibacter macacae]|uniref:Uncharacterized protein n=1 Tax=Gulosibacter macacae TaxID=2488791 RepID=A0A3P3W0M8_9MICO|nr:hypothetical protein [Gulosibacter macacae]RRJ87436.1 hypothetical protein EG850_03800 [Gulosibacter macacae]